MQILQISFFTILWAMLSCSSSKTEEIQINTPIASNEITTQDFWKDYSIESAEYGTSTTVTIDGEYRIMVTNALPNHPTGEFPNPGNPNTISAQKRTYKIPLAPKLSGQSKWAREPGVALNGVKFEPETAERFVCETGEVYRIEAFQELVDMGLDLNHAHVQPTGAYHYHGIPTGLVELLQSKEDIILVGFAHDGFPIYYSQSGQYKPSYKLGEEQRTGDACSYNNPHQQMDKDLNNTTPDGTFVSDWNYIDGHGDLDECNGIAINGEYGYFVTDEYPYMSRCLKGDFIEERRGGPPPRGKGRPEGPPPGSHRHGDGPEHQH